MRCEEARGARLNGGRVEGGDGDGLESRPAGRFSRSCSKSAVSQALIARTRQRLDAALTRRLEDVEPLAPFVDAARVSSPSPVRRARGRAQPQCHAELTADVAGRGTASV